MADKAFYKSEAWLRRRYLTQGRTVAEIMAETGASRKTIYIYLNKFGIKR